MLISFSSGLLMSLMSLRKMARPLTTDQLLQLTHLEVKVLQIRSILFNNIEIRAGSSFLSLSNPKSHFLTNGYGTMEQADISPKVHSESSDFHLIISTSTTLDISWRWSIPGPNLQFCANSALGLKPAFSSPCLRQFST